VAEAGFEGLHVGGRKTLQRKTTPKPRDRESEYRGPSNCHSDGIPR